MFLHGEDWSEFSSALIDKGLPHEGRVIKIFATDIDPREALNNEHIWVIQVSDVAFYRRGAFTELRLEDFLTQKELSLRAKKIARALFRFSWKHKFTQRALELKKDGNPVIDHPMKVVDGFAHCGRNPYFLHLDIFLPKSLPALQKIVNFDDPNLLLDWREGHAWRAVMGKLEAGH